MVIDQIIINKIAHQMAYDNRFEEMSKHNGRLQIILNDILRKDLTIPSEEKENYIEIYSNLIKEKAKKIFNEEVEYVRKYFIDDKKELYLVWGSLFNASELQLLAGYVVNGDGKLDSRIHRSHDFISFEKVKKSPDRLWQSFSLNIRKGGMSGPNDYLDDEINNFDKCPTPVVFLEYPVALLCKLLPLYGVNTVYSCGGHINDKSSPEISFRTIEDFHRAQMLFSEEELSGFAPLNFNLEYSLNRSSWMGMKIIFKLNDFNLESYHAAYIDIFKISKKLLTRYELNG